MRTCVPPTDDELSSRAQEKCYHFFNLDCMLATFRDVKDRSVLKLREQLPNRFAATSPTPAQFFDRHDDVNYFSESELDVPDYRKRNGPLNYALNQRQGRFVPPPPPTTGFYPNRPASAVPPGAVPAPPRRLYGQGLQAAPPKPMRSPSATFGNGLGKFHPHHFTYQSSRLSLHLMIHTDLFRWLDERPRSQLAVARRSLRVQKR